MAKHSQKILALAQLRGYVRARDLAPLGVPRVWLRTLCQQGLLRRVDRGLYLPVETSTAVENGPALVQPRVARGVICLVSALHLHGLHPTPPVAVWVAIPRKARRPRFAYPPVEVVWASAAFFVHGIEAHRIEGVRVRATSPAKTVADCMRLRVRVGHALGVEALAAYLTRYRGQSAKLRVLWQELQRARVPPRVLRAALRSCDRIESASDASATWAAMGPGHDTHR